MGQIDKQSGRSDKQGERGASLLEYTILVSSIALVCIMAITLFGTTTKAKYDSFPSLLFGG